MNYTTEQLTDRWYARRALQNLVGKYVTSLQLKREERVFSAFWSERSDICLGFNDGWYVGPDAVDSYYRTAAEIVQVKSEYLKKLFPEKLSQLGEEQLHGVGQLDSYGITTPVIEVAEDGRTARGLWHVMGIENGIESSGPMSRWSVGWLAGDFILENGNWKIWHLLHAVECNNPMGTDWADPSADKTEQMPDFLDLRLPSLPSYTVPCLNYCGYRTDRPFTSPPSPPEPYDSFSQENSYGWKEGVK